MVPPMITIKTMRRILKDHGIPEDCPDLAVFVDTYVTHEGCKIQDLRNWLGY